MNEQQQITDYVLGQMTEADQMAFEQELARNLVLRLEVESLQKVYSTLQTSEKETDSRLDIGFYEMLAYKKGELNTKNHSKILNLRNIGQIFRYAAVLAGFGFMFWLGRSYAPVKVKTITIRDTTSRAIARYDSARYGSEPINDKSVAQKKKNIEPINRQIADLQQEIKATQELLILGLLQNTSTADRLRGLGIVGKISKPNSLVMNELLKILRTDESLNVRLSAIEALEKYRTEPQIQRSFIAQLSETTEPFEQMSLIGALVQMQAKESLPIIAKLEKDQTTDPSVRLLARNSIDEIANQVDIKEK